MSRRSKRGVDSESSVALAERLAAAAARLIVEPPGMPTDQALRRVSRELGGRSPQDWPDRERLQAAVQSYRRLFAPQQHQQLQRLYQATLAAMEFFAEFAPRLFGPLLQGTADSSAMVTLLLFSDDPDAPWRRLQEHQLPSTGGRWYRFYSGDLERRLQALSLLADGIGLELLVLPERDRRHGLHGADGQRLDSADLATVRQLAASTTAATE